jgi:hypothetical protein
MLRSIVTVAGGALLMWAGAARPARAMTDNEIVKAHVPFTFHVLGTTLPAGNYTLKQLDINEPGAIEIRSVRLDGPAVIFLTVPKSSGTANQPQLLFDDVGQQKFLRAIVLPDQTGVELPEAKAEVDTARRIAAQAKPTHAAS